MIVALEAGRELHVVLGDAADGPVDEGELDVVALELAQALGDRLERALDVGLQHQVERGGLAPLDLLEDVLELGAARRRRWRRAHGRRPGSAARGPRRWCGPSPGPSVTRNSSPAAGGSENPSTWTGIDGSASLTWSPVVVDQGLDLAPGRAGDDGVADPQGARAGR